MSEAPKTIYLQWDDNEFDSTWCSDKINDDDIVYIQNDDANIRVGKEIASHAWTQAIADRLYAALSALYSADNEETRQQAREAMRLYAGPVEVEK